MKNALSVADHTKVSQTSFIECTTFLNLLCLFVLIPLIHCLMTVSGQKLRLLMCATLIEAVLNEFHMN